MGVNDVRGSGGAPSLDPPKSTSVELAALKHLPFGVAVYDSAQLLRYTNDALRSILELPQSAVPLGTPMKAALDFLAKRGEFGGSVGADLAHQRMLQLLDGMVSTFERSRPNGRWIEARLLPLPDGGSLHIYSDITDRVERRWRAEGQIVDLKARIRELEARLSLLE